MHDKAAHQIWEALIHAYLKRNKFLLTDFKTKNQAACELKESPKTLNLEMNEYHVEMFFW